MNVKSPVTFKFLFTIGTLEVAVMLLVKVLAKGLSLEYKALGFVIFPNGLM